MAGVLERIICTQSQRRTVIISENSTPVNPKALELQTAMEILAEVFGISISEVKDMLLERAKMQAQSCKGEYGPWPESFCLE